ncbi:ATP-binding protein [Methylobacterium sp. 1030]|uniref:ATP/GTP-binding protein n=1 Tax=Methylobacterium sp. 1030 TaxID=3156404 RepID=UPI00339ABACA
MKVALTGSHGTGKTTLLNHLAALLEARSESVAVCREVPRVIAVEADDPGFFRRGTNAPLRQALIFFRQVVEEGLREAEADIVLADRTVVDHLAYTVALFPELGASPEGRALTSAVQAWIGRYDLIVKLPIEFPAIDDGTREAGEAFQAEIDHTIDALYEQFATPRSVVRGTVEERAAAVVALIEAARRAER